MISNLKHEEEGFISGSSDWLQANSTFTVLDDSEINLHSQINTKNTTVWFGLDVRPFCLYNYVIEFREFFQNKCQGICRATNRNHSKTIKINQKYGKDDEKRANRRKHERKRT